MDYPTARQFILKQTVTPSDEGQASFLQRIQQGQAPIPGQTTSLLLALRVVGDAMRQEPQIERQLAYALFLLSYESRQCYEAGRNQGIEWPPLLDADLTRLAVAAEKVLAEGD